MIPSRTRPSGPGALLAFCGVVSACGGTAVIDPSGTGAGGAGGATTSGATTSGASSTTTTTGPSGCVSHAQCPGDSLCIFATGECAPACNGNTCDTCGAGSLCDGCATSSCSDCADCLGACRPLEDGECDDDDPCSDPGQACVFPQGFCIDTCETIADCGSSQDCSPCAASSCCGCKDCVDVCVPI